MKFILTLGAAALMGVMGSASSAASVTCNTHPQGRTGQDSTFQIDDALDAACLFGSQDFAADINGLNAGAGAFGFADWILSTRNEADQPAGATGLVTFSTAPTNGVSSGSLALTTPVSTTVTSILISLKTGNASGLFLMDLQDLASNWSIFDTEKDLSHATIFYRDGPTTTPVPLPASGLLLIAALGGLALRRKLS